MVNNRVQLQFIHIVGCCIDSQRVGVAEERLIEEAACDMRGTLFESRYLLMAFTLPTGVVLFSKSRHLEHIEDEWQQFANIKEERDLSRGNSPT